MKEAKNKGPHTVGFHLCDILGKEKGKERRGKERGKRKGKEKRKENKSVAARSWGWGQGISCQGAPGDLGGAKQHTKLTYLNLPSS